MALDKDLEEKAFEIYTHTPPHMRGEKVAIDCFKKAQDFISVRNAMRDGSLDVKAPEGPQLADCCAPNLPKNHPHNIVSQRFGNLEKVNRIKAWLDKNPTPETDQEQIVPRLSRDFPELGWDVPTINVARAIFPAYVKSA